MENLESLQEKLAVQFKNINLLKEALIHRSYLNENQNITQSNERLEFLGDSVLSLVVSSELFNRFKSYPEGRLTSLRSALVRAKTLAEQAEKLRLGDYLLISRGEERSGGRQNKSLLANTFEAVIGAIYLDQGLPAVETFLKRTVFPLIKNFDRQTSILNFKSAYQEQTQEKLKLSPVYKLLQEKGPDHAKTFEIGVYLKGSLIAKGEGKSKQDAEQTAAKNALEKQAEIS